MFKTTHDILTQGDDHTQAALDDLVRDAASDMASTINNGGMEGQIDFLKQQGWGDTEIANAINDKRLED